MGREVGDKNANNFYKVFVKMVLKFELFHIILKTTITIYRKLDVAPDYPNNFHVWIPDWPKLEGWLRWYYPINSHLIVLVRNTNFVWFCRILKNFGGKAWYQFFHLFPWKKKVIYIFWTFHFYITLLNSLWISFMKKVSEIYIKSF